LSDARYQNPKIPQIHDHKPINRSKKELLQVPLRPPNLGRSMIKPNKPMFILQEEKSSLKLGELFCGPGGIALGAMNARLQRKGKNLSIEHSWASDWDEDTCSTYIHNICPENPNSVICSDARKLNISTLSPIDIFAYGFPCNDFSIVGEHRGISGSFGPLYTYGIKIIDRLKPLVIIAENVGGLTSANEGKAFQAILEGLSNAGDGYELTCHKYRFEDYGVPQARHRIIIVGFAAKTGLTFRVPAPTHLGRPISASEAIGKPPIPQNAKNHDFTKQSKTVIERLLKTGPGENVWNADLPDRLRLNVKKTKLSQIYKRLHPDRPSYTITGSGGGGTHGYHWKEPRALTNRERARLQTFPDSFEFKGSKESIRKQIGMAVSPLMSEIIFRSVLKTLAGKEYPFVDENCTYQADLFTKVAKVTSLHHR
jgi:DNA (cytosine-5)-methyltransferase 1